MAFGPHSVDGFESKPHMLALLDYHERSLVFVFWRQNLIYGLLHAS